MESIPRKPLRAACHCSLALLGLTYLLGTADARPMLLPSERFPGPWLEVTQEVRDILTLNKIAACSQAAGRELSSKPRRISPVLHIGREALDKLARTTRGAHPFGARAGSFRISHCRTDTNAGALRSTGGATAIAFDAHSPGRRDFRTASASNGWLRGRA